VWYVCGIKKKVGAGPFFFFFFFFFFFTRLIT